MRFPLVADYETVLKPENSYKRYEPYYTFTVHSQHKDNA